MDHGLPRPVILDQFEAAASTTDQGKDGQHFFVPQFTLSALSLAAVQNKSQMIRLLVDRGAEINGVDDLNQMEYTPLMHAAGLGNLAATRTLLELGAPFTAPGYPGEFKEKMGMTWRYVLHVAASTGSPEVIQALIDNHAWKRQHQTGPESPGYRGPMGHP